MIKMIAVDLDDTLLMEDCTIPEEAVAAIRQAHEKGVTTVIATGRIFPSARQNAAAIGTNAPIVCYNGAQVRLADGTTVLSQAHTPEDILDIARYCKDRSLYLQLYADDQIVVEKTVDKTLVDPDSKVTGIREVGDLTVHPHAPSPKMMIFDTAERLADVKSELETLFPGRFYLATSKPYLLEIMPAGVSKKNTLARLAATMGITPAEIMAIGDNTNDAEMVQWAGTGVAVNNAVPSLKAVAQYVAEQERSFGVVEAIQKFVLSD